MNRAYDLYKAEHSLGGPLYECRTFLEKGIGFMGRSLPTDGHGYWFARTGSLHTFFMRFKLDILFLDADHRVVRICPAVKPWRLVLGGRGACLAIEAPCGTLDLSAIETGEQLVLQPLG